MATRPHTAGTRQKPGRIESLDVFRALAILAVVGIHVLGHFLNDLPPGDAFWLAAAGLNRALQFAVPAFLTLSAFLNLRPLLRGEALGRYSQRRLLRALWPYVLWTLLYALYRLGDLSDFYPGLVWWYLLSGNAYYHLYFLLLVLQLYLLLPLLAPLFRRRPTFGEAAIVTVIFQALLYWLNRRYLLFTAPGSVILWYLPSVALGCWLATRADRLGAVVRRSTLFAAVVTLISGFIYLDLGIALLSDQPLSTAAYQASLWVYAPAATFLLLAAADRLTGSPAQRLLEPLGARSLEIYLVHPMIIVELDRLLGGSLPAGLAIPLYFALCLLLPMALAEVLARLRLSRLFWGTHHCPPRT